MTLKSLADARETDDERDRLVIESRAEANANVAVQDRRTHENRQIRHAAANLHAAGFADFEEPGINRDESLVIYNNRRHHIVETHFRHFGDEERRVTRR